MGERLKLLGVYFLLLIIFMFLLFITFRYIVDVYSKEKLQAQETIIQLQNQIDYLDKQLNKPRDQLKPELFKEYDQKYYTNLQVEFEHAMMSASPHIVQQDIGATLQALKVDKTHQIENIRERSFFSYIPEWPILILGVLGIVATRIINFIVDFCLEWLCIFFKEKQKAKKDAE
jgi:hypothetical protein